MNPLDLNRLISLFFGFYCGSRWVSRLLTDFYSTQYISVHLRFPFFIANIEYILHISGILRISEVFVINSGNSSVDSTSGYK
jgi:hypothetical protein